jgi:hypothetical protein
MAIAARNDRPVSFQQWNAIDATPLDFRCDAGRYGLTLRAVAWGSATLQRVMTDGAGGQIAVDVLPPLAGDGYTEVPLPAGWYRLTLAGITDLTGLIELIERGGR